MYESLLWWARYWLAVGQATALLWRSTKPGFMLRPSPTPRLRTIALRSYVQRLSLNAQPTSKPPKPEAGQPSERG